MKNENNFNQESKKKSKRNKKEDFDDKKSEINDGMIKYVLTIYKADGTFQRIQMTNVVNKGLEVTKNHLFSDICEDLRGIRWEVESLK